MTEQLDANATGKSNSSSGSMDYDKRGFLDPHFSLIELLENAKYSLQENSNEATVTNVLQPDNPTSPLNEIRLELSGMNVDDINSENQESSELSQSLSNSWQRIQTPDYSPLDVKDSNSINNINNNTVGILSSTDSSEEEQDNISLNTYLRVNSAVKEDSSFINPNNNIISLSPTPANGTKKNGTTDYNDDDDDDDEINSKNKDTPKAKNLFNMKTSKYYPKYRTFTPNDTRLSHMQHSNSNLHISMNNSINNNNFDSSMTSSKDTLTTSFLEIFKDNSNSNSKNLNNEFNNDIDLKIKHLVLSNSLDNDDQSNSTITNSYNNLNLTKSMTSSSNSFIMPKLSWTNTFRKFRILILGSNQNLTFYQNIPTSYKYLFELPPNNFDYNFKHYAGIAIVIHDLTDFKSILNKIDKYSMNKKPIIPICEKGQINEVKNILKPYIKTKDLSLLYPPIVGTNRDGMNTLYLHLNDLSKNVELEITRDKSNNNINNNNNSINGDGRHLHHNDYESNSGDDEADNFDILQSPNFSANLKRRVKKSKLSTSSSNSVLKDSRVTTKNMRISSSTNRKEDVSSAKKKKRKTIEQLKCYATVEDFPKNSWKTNNNQNTYTKKLKKIIYWTVSLSVGVGLGFCLSYYASTIFSNISESISKGINTLISESVTPTVSDTPIPSPTTYSMEENLSTTCHYVGEKVKETFSNSLFLLKTTLRNLNWTTKQIWNSPQGLNGVDQILPSKYNFYEDPAMILALGFVLL
ncbi:hypothetical protein TBLA_0E02090 [Henningerozyma blattae CBS 6284]|uniref:Autophagy-related protein 32 n=1 Tax=Henningerozyma blattae (strain ATCC 34711 / CBS 6284 / DSM 70876 / NBRC 10599 / NRRL Y-10934 / UCD 77-7) TaxID=1071380 RepID=I2H4G0_HENB6|nr:hypothetical protein TBLA_0E02090 [Tetrapisispora blattae CBS 6284]CCH61262.1 hypothetical protein TBLA_0E02090 [Tetrapisispora blattae CBS 6284]